MTEPVLPLRDPAIWSLLCCNLVALFAAVILQWALIDLLVIYWMQNVVIGIANIARILALQRFSTSGFMLNNKPLKADEAGKRKVALFFACHYGLFHAFYLFFLIQSGAAVFFVNIGFWLCTLGFAANHWFSYRQHSERDLQSNPNIGNLMALPYLRVIPMHIMAIIGGLLAESIVGLVVFGVLKTAADCAMHVIEHLRLQNTREPSRLPG